MRDSREDAADGEVNLLRLMKVWIRRRKTAAAEAGAGGVGLTSPDPAATRR